MTRWYRPEGQVLRDAIRKRFYGFGAGPHYIYAVVARRDGPQWPIYVGETIQPKMRFEQHLAVAYGGRQERGRVGRIERSIVATGGTLEFHCLAEASNRIRAFALEAAWARAISATGFDLGNTWAEHRPTSKVQLVPVKRLAALSVAEAIAAKLEFGLSCATCAVELQFPADAVAEACKKNPRLKVFARSLNCPQCGRSYALALYAGPEHESMRRIDAGAVDVEGFLMGLRTAHRH
jgi:hypothetical protein